ncbi:MAG: nucleotidyltransferase domain-containing protein [Candidatus Rokuibacteriota bacterium]
MSARPEVLRVGYFGSYARGDWGVGSDLDILIIVEHADEPFWARAAGWDVTGLPVPADVLVYTIEEWERLDPRGRFRSTMTRDGVWMYTRPDAMGSPDPVR